MGGIHRWGSGRGASLLPASWPPPPLGGKGALAATALLRGGRAREGPLLAGPAGGAPRGPGSSHHGPASESAGWVGGYNGFPHSQCGRQGGEPGGQGAAVSRTPELKRREAEGGVSTSRPVPLLRKGAGRRGGGGEEKAAAQPRRL